MTLKGSRRTAQGASPGKRHTSSHLEKHPGSDPERVEQQRPGRGPWRHGRPECQPGKAEAACTALSGRTSGPATVPRACALGCPAGPPAGSTSVPGPGVFPDSLRDHPPTVSSMFHSQRFAGRFETTFFGRTILLEIRNCSRQSGSRSRSRSRPKFGRGQGEARKTLGDSSSTAKPAFPSKRDKNSARHLTHVGRGARGFKKRRNL